MTDMPLVGVEPTSTAARATLEAIAAGKPFKRDKRRRVQRLTRRDKITLGRHGRHPHADRGC